MKRLILQLKQEHVEIARMFDAVKEDIISQMLVDALNDLRELKDILVAHLDLEDKMLYPALFKNDNKAAREIGEKFSNEMLVISKAAMVFFDKYMNEKIKNLLKSSEFEKEFYEVAEVVLKRIKIEEEILYPIYEKFCGVEK